jgi:hypothetical protein
MLALKVEGILLSETPLGKCHNYHIPGKQTLRTALKHKRVTKAEVLEALF